MRSWTWFAVPTCLCLSPLLGKFDTPVLEQLLAFCPTSLQVLLIPASALLAGVTGIWLRPKADGLGQLSPSWLRFAATCAIVGVFSLVAFNIVLVERVRIEGGEELASFIVGPGSTVTRSDCDCELGTSNLDCIAELRLPFAENSGCWWTGHQLMWMKLLFWGLYLLTTLGATTAIGTAVASKQIEVS